MEIVRGRRNTQEDNAVACALRSWVQIPPGPFLLILEIRYYYEFNLDNCRTKSLALEGEGRVPYLECIHISLHS